jgi:hypothetical protein
MAELGDSIPPEAKRPTGTTMTWLNPSHSFEVYFIEVGS